jgi:branched-chain amino acid transport system permease protein
MGIVPFLQPLVSSITYICVLLLATFAVTLIFKTSATTNFAQGTVAAFGCYVASYFVTNAAADFGWNIWAGLAVGVPAGILIGLFIDIVIFRNGRNVNLVGKQIITMGLVSLLGNVIPMIFAYLEPPKMPPLSDAEYILIPIGEEILTVTPHSLICLGLTVVILTVLFLLLRFSKWGLGVRTTASNEYVAQMMGVNTYVITAVSWGIAGGLGTLAAVMFTGENGVMSSPFFMTEFQVNAFLAGILGGFSGFVGPLVGAVIIPIMKMCFGYFAYVDGLEFITQWDMVIVYVIVMIIIYIKPNGIIGKRIAKKV